MLLNINIDIQNDKSKHNNNIIVIIIIIIIIIIKSPRASARPGASHPSKGKELIVQPRAGTVSFQNFKIVFAA